MMLDNRVIVISGATGSLGRVIARTMAEQGAKLAFLGRSAERLVSLPLDDVPFRAGIHPPSDRQLVGTDGRCVITVCSLAIYGSPKELHSYTSPQSRTSPA